MSTRTHVYWRARDPWGRGGSSVFRGGAIRGWVGSEIILIQRALLIGSRGGKSGAVGARVWIWGEASFRSVAQWLARSAHNREVVGSSPAAASNFA